MSNIGDSFIGKPHPAQGSHGDIQLRIDDSPKIFCKVADTWYENVLFPAGEGIHASNKGLVIKHKSKDIISFGTAGVHVDTRATGSDVPLRITNDGVGYSQIIMGGANPELLMGYGGSGTNLTNSIAGSSKIYLNMAGNSLNMASVNFSRAGSVKFVMGSTYESTTDELRIIAGTDPRTEANAGIRINASGHIGFNGVAPAARPDYTMSNVATDRALDCNSTSLDEVADVLATLIKDLIAIGLLQ